MTALKNKGFTLIELLIVIAVLGTLAVVVLLALNPIQQLARTRDAGRISGVTQLGHALEAYAVSHDGTYPPEAGTGCTPANWIGCLVNAGEIATAPSAINNSLTTACTTQVVASTWCYDASAASGATGAIIFSALEGDSNIDRCGTNTAAWAVYSTVNGRGGIVCTANYTSQPQYNSGGQTFIN